MSDLASSALAFASEWRKATEIRREIARCRCTERARPVPGEDEGVPPCYTEPDAEMCEPCQKRVAALARLKEAKKRIASARGKLLRRAANHQP